VSLRITGGAARGRVLRLPVREGVRPTAGRVREAWFSMMGQDLAGIRFLDAFAGSGLMSLEAWSRGARCVAVERDPATYRDLQERIRSLDADIELVRGDALRSVAGLGPFDLVYADPPYAMDPGPVLEALAPTAIGRLTLEAGDGVEVPERAGDLARVRVASYGSCVLHLFERVP
jgi:16S rRNA (guanine966-N2)-methyltransferase